MITKQKLFLIILGIIFIILDKFTLISTVRAYSTIFIQKQIHALTLKLINYPHYVFLQKNKQNQLSSENQVLKQQLEEYSLLVKQSSNKIKDVSAIITLQNKSLFTGFQVIIARAIINVNYLLKNSVLIDKGSSNDIQLGKAVVNSDGIIGQVSTVNQKNAEITLITNPDFKIYLEDALTHSKMLAQGAGIGGLIIKFISKNDPIKVGDILVSTGLDDIYPGNIPAAKINRIFQENNGFNTAYCLPIVDFKNLQYVSILNNESNESN